ncbi:unnamed protein product [Rhizoctonia solani]|uniref:Fungal-specific transcription factor domain protein n=1 Tax=Rhizoctonia solani TaxID=456999 RepID=A0A8H3AKM0_9AGAM|nr:unnamed protein product [Rhizoctonia solani]
MIQTPHQHYPPEIHSDPTESHSSVLPYSDLFGNSSGSSLVKTPPYLTPGQASLFQALFSLEEPVSSKSVAFNPPTPYVPSGPLTFRVYKGKNSLFSGCEDDDPEGVRELICATPTLDPNTVDDALPFVLASFAQWTISDFFDGLVAAHPFRESTIDRFTRSPEARARVIKVANVVSTVSKSPKQSARSLAIATSLQSEAYDSVTRFYSILPNRLALDLYGPISTVIRLMEILAPVFRRACLEPPDRLVNLPNLLLDYQFHRSQFAMTDVVLSATTGRPLFYRYDTSFTPEMGDAFDHGYGLQSLHGVPDRFMIILALISSRYEDFGPNLGQEDIVDIENQIREVKLMIGLSPAPNFTVRRLVVQECWRQALYVYLYMLLCGASADDARVVRAVRAFMQLIDEAKPEYRPDAFLFIPATIVGVATIRKSHRQMICQHMFAIQQRTNFGVSAHDCLSQLMNIWTRTEAEQRVAVWADLKIACYQVSGV